MYVFIVKASPILFYFLRTVLSKVNLNFWKMHYRPSFLLSKSHKEKRKA